MDEEHDALMGRLEETAGLDGSDGQDESDGWDEVDESDVGQGDGAVYAAAVRLGGSWSLSRC
jgi:hypothetical protein